jgi:hypothetical protein
MTLPSLQALNECVLLHRTASFTSKPANQPLISLRQLSIGAPVPTPVQFSEENGKMESHTERRHKSFQAYLQTQCSYWSPENNEFLAGEIVFQWSIREGIRRNMIEQQKELDKVDGILGGLLFERKQQISKLGRTGGWSGWLKQQNIPRSTADRLVLEHAEYFDLASELPHRNPAEPLEGNVCQAAFRTSERFERTLRSPKSRLTFMKVLADLFSFNVELEESDSVRLTMPPPIDAANVDHRVPNVIRIMEDGAVLPVDYELHDEAGA